MDTVYLDRRGTSLDTEGGRFIVRNPDWSRPFTIPVQQVSNLVISAETALTSTVLLKCASAGVCLIVINPRRHAAIVSLVPAQHGNVHRRLCQYEACQNNELKRWIAGRIARAKVRGQVRTLCRLLEMREDLGRVLVPATGRLREYADRLADAQDTVDCVRGLEGAASAAYFAAYQCAFAPALDFRSRNRRPPRDPVNTALSLGYTLAVHDASRVLAERGLDPMLGFLHEAAYGRESLACDLVEIVRPRVDLWVQSMFADRTLRAESFSIDAAKGQGCMMQKVGRAAFYQSYAEHGPRFRSLMMHFASGLAGIIDRQLKLPLNDVEPDTDH